jgi:hypothetical protein
MKKLFINIFDWFKRKIFYFRNNKARQDKNGKIIDDWKRRKHIKETERKIKSGEIIIPENKGDNPRCYQVMSKSEFRLKGSGVK